MQENMQMVDRILDLIEQLALSGKSLGPTRLAELTGLNKSTVHRLLAAMHSRGYVDKTEDGTYRLGPKLIEVVSSYINSLELLTEARPFLTELSGDLSLTTHIGVLDGWEVVYVEKLDAIPTGRIASQIGYRVPAYCSSLGKCLLASLAGDELEEAMEECRFERFTDRTIQSLPELRQHLREVRAQGWAMDDQEHEPGHRCVAAPIYDYRGDVIAAVSASGMTTRLSDALIPTTVAAVRQAAANISRRLGYIR